MKRPTKIAFLFALYLAAHFTEACNPCDCPENVLPYFDYHEITVQASREQVKPVVTIEISPDSIEFLAQVCPEFSVMSSAYGCSCDFDGYEGDKYAPIGIDVFADRDFNDTLKAGQSLRSIFYGRMQGNITTTLSPQFKPGNLRRPRSWYEIKTNKRPTNVSDPFRFTVQWVKSNGDTLKAQTNSVFFQ